MNPDTAEREPAVQALEALADATRRAILTHLRQRELAVGELASRLPVTRPAVSQHLKVLREAGLVDRAGGGYPAPLPTGTARPRVAAVLCGRAVGRHAGPLFRRRTVGAGPRRRHVPHRHRPGGQDHRRAAAPGTRLRPLLRGDGLRGGHWTRIPCSRSTPPRSPWIPAQGGHIVERAPDGRDGRLGRDHRLGSARVEPCSPGTPATTTASATEVEVRFTPGGRADPGRS